MTGYSVGVSGYAAMAQIRDARPHRWSVGDPGTTPLATAAIADERPVTEDLVGRSFDERIAEWWDSLTENLSQMTFFLLDPESWR
jgi:hypothetical protein